MSSRIDSLKDVVEFKQNSSPGVLNDELGGALRARFFGGFVESGQLAT
jgi:hypothetical protein